MAPHAIHRDVDELRTMGVELGVCGVVEGHLIAADGTPDGRIEGQDHRSAAKVFQSYGLVSIVSPSWR